MNITAQSAPYIEFTGVRDFSAAQTFDCGQCFRFERAEIGAAGGFGGGLVESGAFLAEPGVKTPGFTPSAWEGVAYGRHAVVEQPSPGVVRVHGDSFPGAEEFWRRYLSLDEDYGAYKRELAALELPSGSGALAAAAAGGWGIRLLRQEPFEALCSFIISQNNNIPRIKKIIGALCSAYGEPFTSRGRVYRAFPTPEALKNAGIDGLFALKTGFRAKYIHDAASAVADRRLDLAEVAAMQTATAAAALQTIKGVGPKVASCVLLYGLGKRDVFPTDVWIKRVVEKYFGAGFDPAVFGDNAGIAQQYLFYYERWNGGFSA